MTRQRDVVQKIPAEADDYYSDDDLFTINSWGADLSFRELIERYTEGALEKPELQRHYVWDRTEASRFIDSLLLGLPVPSIFLAKTEQEKLLIVDGYQRIMTVHDFVSGIFSGDGRTFKLSSSRKINKRWRGRAFAELSDVEQRRIRNTTIHAIIFVQQQPSGNNTSLYQVFERINTSGRTLLPQEIRNCIYGGSLNTLLLNLNTYEPWRDVFGLPKPESRMRDMEFILRFFALSSPGFAAEERERISLKKYLNVYMGTNRHAGDSDILALQKRFTSAIDVLRRHFGPGAFHNVSPSAPDKLVPRFSPTIFDSLMIATDQAIAEGIDRPVANPEAARRALLRDEDYRRAITQETMRTETIRYRVSRARTALYPSAKHE
jgi:hypothetical protein